MILGGWGFLMSEVPPINPERGTGAGRHMHGGAVSPSPLRTEKIFIKIMTSDRELKASREGSKCRNTSSRNAEPSTLNPECKTGAGRHMHGGAVRPVRHLNPEP